MTAEPDSRYLCTRLNPRPTPLPAPVTSTFRFIEFFTSIPCLFEKAVIIYSSVSSCALFSLIDGPMVKRLRRRPLKAQSRVRFSLGSPLKNPVHMNRVFFCIINHDLRSIAELHFKRSRISLIQILPSPLRKKHCPVRLLCT